MLKHFPSFMTFLVGEQPNCDAATLNYMFVTRLSLATRLQWLDISYCNVSTLCFLKYLPNLELLNLSSCTLLVDQDFTVLSKCLTLDHLYLSFTNVAARTIVELSKNWKLLMLDTVGIQMYIQECHEVLATNSQSLLYFHLSVNEDVTNQQFHQEIVKKYVDCSFRVSQNTSSRWI